MSEKRFKLSKWCGAANTSCILDEQGHMLYGEVVNRLNELQEENQELKEDIKRLKRQVKTFKEDRDANFESAKYWREQLEKIPETIKEVWIE